MKKGFTLIEIIVSISLFMILLLFLYHSLNVTKSSNNFYETKLDNLNKINSFKSILYEDIAQSSNVEIFFDAKGESILKLISSNLFHNLFYKHITYVLNKKGELIRIESFDKFNEKELLDSFFDEAYLDIVFNDIDKFKITPSKSNQNIYSIFLRKKNGEIVFFNTLSISK
ncbi:hypothetical protein CRV08_08715 [Halarcobacter ebronensis]|uniref:Prepilin-type cleavage/methylation domain-containing protein n=1 Tax=Halarcobacter ebronensis TaxID=1462615 RepID=A0A4Q0YDZ0_9BACT|nr:prepilin-type N-terminal cleavage/methylation domain-containing protein [Halarcobacter ebronensis]RXJ68323.1 hypothetical protein CRV08_08715 [Halarcobacter ebronensis]